MRLTGVGSRRRELDHAVAHARQRRRLRLQGRGGEEVAASRQNLRQGLDLKSRKSGPCVPSRAVPCRAVPCRAVPRRAPRKKGATSRSKNNHETSMSAHSTIVSKKDAKTVFYGLDTNKQAQSSLRYIYMKKYSSNLLLFS